MALLSNLIFAIRKYYVQVELLALHGLLMEEIGVLEQSASIEV